MTVEQLRAELFQVKNQQARVEFSLDFGGETLYNSTKLELILRDEDGYIEIVSSLDDNEEKIEELKKGLED